MVFERLNWRRAARVQKTCTLPLVLVGVLLSTLHQSSLGALYLIAPGKLHPLWYTAALPWLFWTSAVCAGLAMVIVESRLSSRAFGRQLELPLLTDLSRALLVGLGVFAVFRLEDLAGRGALGRAFEPTYEAAMFHLEFLLGVLLPFALLLWPRVRGNSRGLYGAALLVVLGFVTNRLNVSITGLEGAMGGRYVPAWSEVAISTMLVAVGFAAFGLAVRYLPVYPEPESPAESRGPAHPVLEARPAPVIVARAM
jgi:Ni/Fe-hydrogenase subunit HybB-like protein